MPRAGTLCAAAALVAAVALAAAHAPLWVYATSLALFGLPHVLVELRYVDERFAGRLPRRALLWLGAGLLGVAALRALAFAGVTGPLAQAELALGVGLVAVAAPLLTARANPAPTLLAFAVAAALVTGIVYAPLGTLVLLALLHNLTPVGFLAERLHGAARRRALLAATAVFVAVPAALVAAPYFPAVISGPLETGELPQHVGAFVPSPLIGTALGERLFAAAAYLQVMHYAVVLGVLPRLGGGDQRAHAVLPWPRPMTYAIAVALLGAVAAGSFAADFAGARSGYAIFAAVHAWIEIPTLLLACAIGPAMAREARPA
ncbi:MAG: hypothetical protein KAI24_25500 [Planctomycetes bacterium]|nr:hypothetical protein [Planctomycetota bacterium]